ncbi:MAG: hypothetical protein P1U87_18775 [Verrucomicrobiales bacterium]|nr:hypothetical protein [Verrucomicrobiales bacterium]
MLESDTVILLSPVTFGGYSSEIKKVQDRWLPLILPDFGIYHGEVHHVPRYSRYPRWIGIGLQETPHEEEAHLFQALVGRNALNFHAPSYAAEVFLTSESGTGIQQKVQGLIERADSWPLGDAITSIMPGAVVADTVDADPKSIPSDQPRRALLIVGSPKVSSPSTTGVLGGYVLTQMEKAGWETSTLTLRRKLLKEKGQAELVTEAERADLILLTFPLYIDSLPFLMMKALEIMADKISASPGVPPKQIAVIVNNGFPEAYHNAVAVAICRRFAIDAGMTWMGGLDMGAGEALFRGQPFEETKRNGPPVFHVKEALELAGTALAKEDPIPAEAIRLIRKSPIPFVPFRLWRRFFIKSANQHWQRLASGYGVDPTGMKAVPYAGTPN